MTPEQKTYWSGFISGSLTTIFLAILIGFLGFGMVIFQGMKAIR